MHGQLFPEQAAGEQHRGDPTSAGLDDEPAQVFLELGAELVADGVLHDRIAPLLDLLDVAAHAEPVDALLRIRVRYRAFGEMVVHAGHCFEQRRRCLVQPALRLEERAMPMHGLVGEARLALRMTLEDRGCDDVGLVVVRLHPVVRIVDRTRRDPQLAVVDGDVEGCHVVVVAEVRRRVREDLADGCALAAQRVSALGDPGRQVGPDCVHPVLREELEPLRVADRRRCPLRQGSQVRCLTVGHCCIHRCLLNSRFRYRPRPMSP